MNEVIDYRTSANLTEDTEPASNLIDLFDVPIIRVRDGLRDHFRRIKGFCAFVRAEGGDAA